MKRTTKYFAIAILALFITSFMPGKARPMSVTASFLSALSAGDFVKAKTFVSEDSKEAFESLETLAGDGLKGIKYSVIKEDIQDKTASVTYSKEGEKGNYKMSLMKIKNDWKIVFDKSSFLLSFD